MERMVSSEQILDGKLLKIRRDIVSLDNGGRALREVVRHPGGAVIAPLDADGCLWFVRQYRYAVGEELEELPAGKLGWGEDPDLAAARELREETGFTADSLRKLGESYPSPGYTAEKLHFYLAEGLHPGEQQPDEDEVLTLFRLPLEEAAQRVLAGGFRDAKTQALILMVSELVRRRKA